MRHSTYISLIFFSFFSFLNLWTSNAQNVSEIVTDSVKRIQLKKKIDLLQEVVVTANRQTESRREVPAAVSKVSLKTIKDTTPNTMDQVLNKLPGVFVADLGNEQHMTSLRSPISTKSIFLFLEDGLPMRPSGIFSHNVMNELNLGAIKSVEVIRGPTASAYGADAVAGAINFITKTPTVDFKGRAGLRANTNGLHRADFEMSNSFKKTGVYVGGYYAYRGEGFTEHSSMDKYGVHAKVVQILGSATDLKTSLVYIDHRTDMTGTLNREQFFGKSFSSVQTFTARTVKALRIQSTLNHEWSSKNQSTIKLFFRDNTIGQIPSYRISKNRVTGVVSGRINAAKLKSFGAVLQHVSKFSIPKLNRNMHLTAGVTCDYSPTNFFEDYIVIEQNNLGRNIGYKEVDSMMTRNEIDIKNVGAYLNAKLDLTKKMKLITAVRADLFQYRHRNFLKVSSFSGAPNSRDNFSAFTPKLGLTYTVGKCGKNTASRCSFLYGNISRAFLPPQISELYEGVKVPVLEPSIFMNYEMGAEMPMKLGEKIQVIFMGSVYLLESNNQIISVIDENGVSVNRNAGATVSKGIEYGLNARFGDDIDFRWGGTFADHRVTKDSSDGILKSGKFMPWGANYIFNWELGYRPDFVEGLRLSLEHQRVGPYYMDVGNDVSYDGFNILNFRAGYMGGGLEIVGSVMNIADVLWSTRASAFRWGERYTPGIPRTFQLSLAYDF